MLRSFRLIALVGGLFALVPPASVAADAPELIGHTAGVSYAVAVDGDLAAIGAGRRALLLDISDLKMPVLLGASDVMPRTVRSLDLRDGRLLVGLEESDVYVFDVAEPTNPAQQAIFETDGEVRDIAADDQFAYLASFGDGVIVIDVGDLADPSQRSLERTSRDINDVVVSEGVLYATSATGGLHAFAIDERGRLEILSTVVPVVGSGKANQMAVEGGRVFVANGKGVVSVGVDSPNRPELLGAFTTNGGARDIAIRGDRVFVADGMEGVLVVDVSDSLLPKPLGAIRLPFDAVRLEVEGDLVFAIDWVTGLHILDISGDPAALGTFGDLGFARSVARSHEAVFLGLARNRIVSLEPSTLAIWDSQPLPASAQELSVRTSDGNVYVGDVRAGLWAFGANPPETLRLLDHMPMEVRDLEVAGATAFVTAGLDGFQTASIADPTTLLGLQKIDSTAFSWGISLVGSLAYIADRENGIQVVDVSSPAILTEVGRISGLGRTRDVEVRNGLAYVADFDKGLLIFDVSVPAQPRLIGEHHALFRDAGDSAADPYLHPQRVVLSSGGRYAIVANSEAMISIIDISRPNRPSLDATLDLSWPAGDLYVYDDQLYVAAGGEGLLVYRMDDGVGNLGTGPRSAQSGKRPELLGALPLIVSLLMIAAAVAGLVVLRRNGAGQSEADLAPSDVEESAA